MAELGECHFVDGRGFFDTASRVHPHGTRELQGAGSRRSDEFRPFSENSHLQQKRLLIATTAGEKSALRQLFHAVLQQTNLSAMDIEVDAALAWMTGMLNGVTPFSTLPTDMKPGNASPGDVAKLVYDK